MAYVLKKKNLDSMDRGTLKGFKRYMLANPYYYRDIFGNIPIEHAWKEVRTIQKSFEPEGFNNGKDFYKSLRGDE